MADSPTVERFRAMRDARLAEDHDFMVATGRDLDWLMAQLACWPERVDHNATTNMRFLMLSAAATLQTLRAGPQAPEPEQQCLAMLSRDTAKMRQAGGALAEAAGYVVRECDGLHRLSLAIGDWYRCVANEGDRDERHGQPVTEKEPA